MGLKATLQKLATIPFRAAGDVVIKAQYVWTENNGFNDATITAQPLKLIKAEMKSGGYINQFGGVFSEAIKPTDLICMTPTLLCDYPIEEGGEITFPNGSTYTVKEVSTDPADAVYTLLLRKV